MHSVVRFVGVAVVLAAGGCEMYLGGHGGEGPDGGDCPEAWVEGMPRRNPETGACDIVGGGLVGCGHGYGVTLPDWGACYGACGGLDEATCRGQAQCRAIYDLSRGEEEFTACWPVAPSGPIATGGCDGLDAYQCSQHDDCVAVYDGLAYDGIGRFVTCDAEDFCQRDPCACVPAVPTRPRMVRNPETGMCEEAYDGGCGGGAEPPYQDWAECDSWCEALDEKACTTTAGCRVIYGQGDDSAAETWFVGCWATAPSGPVEGRGCGGLGAYDCSRHDDCRAVYQWGLFDGCENERPLVCIEEEQLRNPDTGACETFGGCLVGDTVPPLPSWGACYGRCTDLDEDTCRAAYGCQAIYVDSCPSGAADDCDAGPPRFAACWATSPDGSGGGECEGLDALACSQRDDCVATHEQVAFACDCDDCICGVGRFQACSYEAGPPPPCADTFDEASCIANPACEPLYEGHDCSCDDTGCTCGAWEFLACRDGDAPRACGGEAGIACADDEYCDYADDGCGWDDGGGVCRKRPASCPDVDRDEPLCACDSRTYWTACEAAMAGVDLDSDTEGCRE